MNIIFEWFFDSNIKIWYNVLIYYKNTNMDTDDILMFPISMGPHARASRTSRIQALKEYGISPNILDIADDNRHIAQSARIERERILKGEVDILSV